MKCTVKEMINWLSRYPDALVDFTSYDGASITIYELDKDYKFSYLSQVYDDNEELPNE